MPPFTVSRTNVVVRKSVILQKFYFLFLKYYNIWEEWYNWLNTTKLNPLEACIRYTNSLKSVDKIVVGINSAHQLKQITKYMRKPKLKKKPNWQNSISKDLIDPRLWK